MAPRQKLLTIGELSARTGVAVSAIRYYADGGLVHAYRTNAGQRRFARADIRRVSFILIAQQLGLSLEEIRSTLDQLPEGRTPNKADWARISTGIKARVDARMAELERIRSRLDGCIGCGCLSLETCQLYNPGDKMGKQGSGPRRLLAD
ncbi:redox-sensitive transcriptional activator SoxR [Oceanicaulis alexandrii]|jgi:MerR family redox-sensitive transcriptional activator SoxR|uniref:redox-sensitive transcriptional activator SoxR n=1 Tax=Oceanicaulis alexandrii TaxID=153233 RepID=UPI0003B32409|nr:redox-sensitive transcriptional activator SoxR [Oceanicaulis alexandrii]MBL4539246.1 redox-sensitive transcriptional activator SoxR [Oceanicaulis sp.]VXC95310.1 HTH-type transcriptional activator SoxR homolog [Oceanicaulis sp. 350]|tara:strand:+ start:555 stop:1001 length:447 start_codon:yes stop_codon:yes gene_type:complete